MRAPRKPPIRRHPQRFLFDALASLLQDIFLTAVDEPGQMPLKLTIDAAATQESIPFVATAPGFTT